ncbi:MAG: hypothetical protein R3236_09150, partial [Phycisphaeraceae bacterium]|nr:hypothetical protein [Phycisphaeraceae bacterium]
SKICSPDKTEQKVAERYLIREVYGSDPQDPRLSGHPAREAALDFMRRKMRTADPACFRRSIDVLSQLGVWGRRFDGRLWVRSLLMDLDAKRDVERRGVARALGQLLWHRWEGHSDPRIPGALEQLLLDEDALVRHFALLAAACLDQPDRRMALVLKATEDADDDIAMRAWILLGLLREGSQTVSADEPAPPVGKPDDYRAKAVRFAHNRLLPPEQRPEPPRQPPPGADPVLKRLAQYESMPTVSADVSVEDETLPMLRIEAVRVSRRAEPDDLLPVYNLSVPPLRMLATTVALERFDAEKLNQLAAILIRSFEDNHRMAGAMLGGMFQQLNDKNLDRMWWRQDQSKPGHAGWWTVKSHYKLGLWMRGLEVHRKIRGPSGNIKKVPFVPQSLMGVPNMPRSTTAVGLMHRGDLSGLDYFLDPFGKPPVSLVDLFSRFRYQRVVRRYVPDLPEIWDWADDHTKVFQVEVIRAWYLLHRRDLRFDSTTGQFHRPDSVDAS